MDLMPTIVEVTNAEYPQLFNGQDIHPMEGVSLLSSFKGGTQEERTIGFEHQFARGLRKGNWKIAWGKRMPEESAWELYDLSKDRTEQNNLAKSHPEITETLAAEWMDWAERLGVKVSQ